ncbi:MAG: hypothetical protein HKN82_16540 [Akkermansiaceae bacterium]|nr:hypothetical protein [Akkermansiaceae bacterium]NNM29980.1 hypothetical protein [Akkermansiaceae bacterium]
MLVLAVAPPASGATRHRDLLDATRAERGRFAWFAATSVPDGLGNPILVQAGKEVLEVVLPRRSASLPVKVPADGVLRIVKRADDAVPPDGEPAFETLAEVSIPERARQALIILEPAADDADPLVVATVHDLVDFKRGAYLFINQTKMDVAVEMGDARLDIKPAGAELFLVLEDRKPVSVPISYRYRRPNREKWHLLGASTVLLSPTRREICVFSTNPKSGRIDYHGITFPVTP